MLSNRTGYQCVKLVVLCLSAALLLHFGRTKTNVKRGFVDEDDGGGFKYSAAALVPSAYDFAPPFSPSSVL